MRTAREALIALFRRHPNVWLNHATVYEAGRHNMTARLSELRQEGFGIEQRGRGELSEYRMTRDPHAVVYQQLACTVCDWRGDETKAIGGNCGRCGSATVQVEAPKQLELIG